MQALIALFLFIYIFIYSFFFFLCRKTHNAAPVGMPLAMQCYVPLGRNRGVVLLRGEEVHLDSFQLWHVRFPAATLSRIFLPNGLVTDVFKASPPPNGMQHGRPTEEKVELGCTLGDGSFSELVITAGSRENYISIHITRPLKPFLVTKQATKFSRSCLGGKHAFGAEVYCPLHSYRQCGCMHRTVRLMQQLQSQRDPGVQPVVIFTKVAAP